MNEIIRAIKERRSIRSYKNTSVSEKDIFTILEACSYSPSARNKQACHITVLTKPQQIAELNTMVIKCCQKPGFDRYKQFVSSSSYSINFQNAPVFMIVGASREESFCPVEDGTLILGNILLSAFSLGLGACWINQLGSIECEPEFRKYLSQLNFPESHRLIGSACLGYPEGNNPVALPRKTSFYNII
jgi:nitroreductase